MPASGILISIAYSLRSGLPENVTPVPFHAPLAPLPSLVTTASVAGISTPHTVPFSNVPSTVTVVTPSTGPRKGKEILEEAKKTTTTCAWAVETTSKYHHSPAVSFTADR